MNEEYLYVLDFSNCTLNCICLSSCDKEFENAEELLEYYGFKADNCNWMFSSVELNINYIIEPIKN